MRAYPTYNAQQDDNRPTYGTALHSRYPIADAFGNSNLIATFYPAAEERDPEPAAGAFPVDLASFVFANQMQDHQVKAEHLDRLLADRQVLTGQHMADLDRQIEQLKGRIPLRLYGPGAPYQPPVTEAEKQIMNLERQKRTLEVGHWRDTHELRTALLERQTEHRAVARRMGYLGGGDGGGGYAQPRYVGVEYGVTQYAEGRSAGGEDGGGWPSGGGHGGAEYAGGGNGGGE